ncbi:hypothetical protein KUCAC02_010773 [Chaenocephalus aceratus]|uniref:Uncharacterized protein n=1 Tax=Chaenocephalus aceratus TaxID=36190 RepID=A0ACB9WVH6_CHAAC|nr:hypothetical protein KUCAC02_010773 [Chaenocephalus aceratus]
MLVNYERELNLCLVPSTTTRSLAVKRRLKASPAFLSDDLMGVNSLPGYFCTVIRIYVDLCASVHQETLLPCKLYYSLFPLEVVKAGYEGTRCALLSPLDGQPVRSIHYFSRKGFNESSWTGTLSSLSEMELCSHYLTKNMSEEAHQRLKDFSERFRGVFK